jgi:hypothetical protein
MLAITYQQLADIIAQTCVVVVENAAGRGRIMWKSAPFRVIVPLLTQYYR